MGLFAFDEFSPMCMTVFSNNSVSSKAIRLNRLVFLNICLYQALNGGAIHMVHHRHLGITDPFSIGGGFNDDRCFGTAPASFIPTILWATKEGIVHFNNPCQFVCGISLTHRTSNLLKHCPSSPVTYTELLGKRKSRKASFIRTEQVYGPKPDQKRCPGPVHHGVGRQRGLVTAIPALIQFSLGNEIVLMMPAARTHKTLRPAKLKEPLLTILFTLIFLLEFQKVRLFIWLFHLVTPLLLYIVCQKLITTIYRIG